MPSPSQGCRILWVQLVPKLPPLTETAPKLSPGSWEWSLAMFTPESGSGGLELGYSPWRAVGKINSPVLGDQGTGEAEPQHLGGPHSSHPNGLGFTLSSGSNFKARH